MADIYLSNSLTRKKEKFIPINPPKVGMYTCGMTVYDYAHIGHGRKYVGDDILRRVLTVNGYQVNHVQNVTDVGHLVSDADEGEDKLEKGAKKEGKTVWEVAEFFSRHFYDSMDELNVLRPTTIAKATEHISDQIELVRKLINKGFAYDTPEAVYFDIEKFADYPKLFGQDVSEKKVGARDEVKTGEHKKHPADFVLWFKRVGRFANHTMHWESPWGVGFPGWHIECSAMSMKYLGEQFDIHTGGEDHLSVHHPNEIAQSEAASGKKPFVKYWIHNAFLKVNGKKMSKSLGNLYTIEDMQDKGYEPLALRYLYLTAHYRDPLNFTWEALEAAQNALEKLRQQILTAKEGERKSLSIEKEEKIEKFRQEFIEAVNDDLNTPKALAVLWQVLKSDIPPTDKYDLALYFDEILGLGLSQIIPEKVMVKQTKSGHKIITPIPLSTAIISKIESRELSRSKGDFPQADRVRLEIQAEDKINIKDTVEGTVVEPINNNQN